MTIKLKKTNKGLGSNLARKAKARLVVEHKL